MNGTWKERVSGYDRKGNKRRTQTRKHLLKDKAKIIIRKYHYNDIENDVFHNEANNYILSNDEPKYRSHGFVEVWTVRVDRYQKDKRVGPILVPVYSESVRTAYEFDGKYYNYYDGTQIVGDIFKKLDFIENVEIDYPYRLEINHSYRRGYVGIDDELFIYGKPIGVDWINTYGFWSTKGRKYAQRKVNSMDRQRVRDYISNCDWDSDVKTHALSKSIAWEIY